MKSILVVLLLASLPNLLQAQQFKVPKSPPGKLPLPTPNIRLPADLSIACSPISAVTESVGVGGFGERQYTTYITVSIAIANRGQLASKPITIQGMIAGNSSGAPSIAPPALAFSDSKINIRPWIPCSMTGDEIPAIEPGTSIVRECTFMVTAAAIGAGRKFFFCALADYYKTSGELNLSNNLSAIILINNPNY